MVDEHDTKPRTSPTSKCSEKQELVTAALPDLYAEGADTTVVFEIMEQVESMRAQREIVDSLGFRV